ncbi:phosphatidate cytidylyltransferase [Periweissella cryptocerci]|uniref:Phosphatidate cytidylyltransferase n=1 Tax=Periweissella cryptocerci TaxID=2506420 RepID=A0A4P6YRQ0_9LACO|nr:phosphatidate cytidylyltransferase [Periweissella cryptocerci]QBO35273.1 phosphatidate cytidylyltransferase [Periweissella cryptocerci]
MKTRVITAVVALAVFIPLLIIGHLPLQILVALMAVVALDEILIMRKKLLISFETIISNIGVVVMVLPRSLWDNEHLPMFLHQSSLLYIFVLLMLFHTVLSRNHFTFDDAGVITLSMLYIGLGFQFFMAARTMSLATLFFALLIVWITDSGAYMIGRALGKHKLAPRISPNKTWEGSIGGTVVSVIVSAIYLLVFPAVQVYSFPVMLVIALFASIAGQFGDLIESALKRYYNVKDSGKILPGHGGILDRFDSLLIVLPVLFLLGVIH